MNGNHMKWSTMNHSLSKCRTSAASSTRAMSQGAAKGVRQLATKCCRLQRLQRHCFRAGPSDEDCDLVMGAVPYGIAGEAKLFWQENTLALNWFNIYDHHIIISSYHHIIISSVWSTGNLVRKLLHLPLSLKRSEATYHQHRFQLKTWCAMCHPRPVASRMRSPSP